MNSSLRAWVSIEPPMGQRRRAPPGGGQRRCRRGQGAAEGRIPQSLPGRGARCRFCCCLFTIARAA
eukprot:6441735-Alexandrium_andersonii.AAC.1